MLANKVIAAEFPDVELLNSFQVFSLTDNKRARDLTQTKAVNALLGRLARALALDFSELLEQYTLVEPYARKLHATKGTSNFSAWKEATLWHRKRKRGNESRRALSRLTQFGCRRSLTRFGRRLWTPYYYAPTRRSG
eukprot:7769123-Pyramimonas_sp.AAC.1